jgi:hypothetical protein
MKIKEKLVKKESKNGKVTIIRKIVEGKTYWIHDYIDTKAGMYGSFTYDEEGEIIGGDGGSIPYVFKSLLKD